MLVSKQNTMAMKSYQNHAEVFVRDYLLDDSFVPYTSIIGGIFACKLVYDLTQLMSTIYFKSYCNLTKMQRIEWNNRAISTIHALFITTLSLYFVFMSDLFSDERLTGLITHRSSALSTFALGISVGYFIADIGMIIWFYPSLGGMEYHCPFGVLLAMFLHHYFFDNWVIHHLLSMAAVAYAMLTGEGQLYTYMVLISETTTPGVNLRWYLDAAGMKKSRTYLINGVVMFVAWLVARILLFMYLFYHVFLHYDQVKELHGFGRLLIFVVPVVLSVMNSMWFWKIIRGLKKTLAKRQ